MVYLEAKSVDDALELLDLLMMTELLGKAEREADRETVRRHPRLARASAKLAAAVEILLEATGWDGDVGLDEVWESIEAVLPRAAAELRAAVETVADLVPPPDADLDGAMRAELATRIATVSGFLKLLTEVITFGANAEAAPVLAAMQAVPRLLDGRRSRRPTAADIDPTLVTGSWKRLVYGSPRRPGGAIDRTPT